VIRLLFLKIFRQRDIHLLGLIETLLLLSNVVLELIELGLHIFERLLTDGLLLHRFLEFGLQGSNLVAGFRKLVLEADSSVGCGNIFGC